MRRHSWKILLALSISALGLSAAATAVSALTVPTSTTLDLKVSHAAFIKLGTGSSFIASDCVQVAGETEVPCYVPPAPARQVEIWCLAPTPLGGVKLRVDFQPLGVTNPINSVTYTANCAAAAIPGVRVGNQRTITPMKQVAGVTLNSCTFVPVAMGDPSCQTLGNRIRYSCPITVTFYLLPHQFNVTVQLQGPTPINLKTINLSFRCVA